MSPYLWAILVLTWASIVTCIIALFMGRDRMIDDLKREWAEAEK